MTLYLFLVIAHIAGAILGVGGATFIEVFLNNGNRQGLKSAVFVTRVGMAVGLISGLGFIWIYYANNQLFRLESPVFWTKMGLFLLIIINAYLLHKHKISLFWGSALSFVTWWYVMLLGIFFTEGVRYSWIEVIGAYLVLLVGGAFLLHKIRERSKRKREALAAETPPPDAPKTP